MLHYIPQSTQFLNKSRLFSKHSAVNNFRALKYVVLVRVYSTCEFSVCLVLLLPGVRN